MAAAEFLPNLPEFATDSARETRIDGSNWIGAVWACVCRNDRWMDLDVETVIVMAAQGGSESAWRALFELHFDAVYRFCFALTAGRRELADETARQVFVRMKCGVPGIRGPISHTYPWSRNLLSVLSPARYNAARRT